MSKETERGEIMKLRGKKLLSVLLVMMMLASTGVLHVLADDSKTEEPQKPQLHTNTESSIVLKTEENYKYAVQINKEGTKSWQWAKEDQYNRENNTVSFKGLKADTLYKFACKPSGADKVQAQNIQSYRTKAAAPEKSAVAEPKASGSDENKKAQSTAPSVTENNKTTDAKPAGANIESTNTTDTNTIDRGAPDTDTGKKDGGEAPQADPKADTPPLPEILDITDKTVKFGLPQNIDPKYTDGYRIYFSEDGGSTYKSVDSPYELGGLTADTKYLYYAATEAGKYGEAQYKESDPTETLSVRTLKAASEPNIPVLSSRTDTTVTLVKDSDYEYALFASGAVSGSWEDSGEFTGLTPDTAYEFVARIKGTADMMPSEASLPLSVRTLKSAAAAPDAPVIASRSDTSITLKAKADQEYAILDGDKKTAWQTSPEFNGLTPNTEYQFITRTVFDPDEAMESQASAAVSAKTVIAFTGSAITGVAADAVYAPGTTLTAVAVGGGMDNINPSKDDTRWVPDSWYWSSKSIAKWDKEPYKVTFTLKTAGSYKLTVIFRLEEYNGSVWTSLDKTESASVSFKVASAAVTSYTITASNGSGGTISPSGNLHVEKGKSSTFQFTPDKGFQVAKVYIDGKVTKVKNNKYTFENVTANHTISVTFEKAAKLTAAKTGDSSMLPFWLAAIVSGCCIVLFVVKYRRKKRN